MKTTVGLYGSVHNPDFLKKRGWDEDKIRRLFIDFCPDIICGEVRPEDYIKTEGYRGPGEYRRFIFDLCSDYNITFCPCDSFDELTLSLNEDFDETAPRWTDIMERYMAAGYASTLPFNSEEYNKVVREKQDYQEKAAPQAHRIIWDRRNQNIINNISQVVQNNPGKRILVVFGAEHSYIIKERLEKLENVKLIFPIA